VSLRLDDPGPLDIPPAPGYEYVTGLATLGPPDLAMASGPTLDLPTTYSGPVGDLLGLRLDAGAHGWVPVPHPVTLVAGRAGVQVDGPGLYAVQRWTGVGVGPGSDAGGMWLRPPFPNPSSASMRLAFGMPRGGRARLTVIDLAGRVVARPLDAWVPAGAHAVAWDGRGTGGRPLAAGVYELRLECAGGSRSVRLVRMP
jgi:hypothetical protein